MFEVYLKLFGNAPYRRFWIGCTPSILGDAPTKMAFTWFVHEQARSASTLGILKTSPRT